MELPNPFEPDGEHFAIDLPGARALFTSRRGGQSLGPYASLNLGLLTGDSTRDVQANRREVAERYGVRPVWGRQVHGARVVVSDPERPEPAEADGQATGAAGIAPLVLTADCLAVGVAGGGTVAMLHAGWRGLADGVIEAGVARLRELGARGPLEAAIGPHARSCCYEVGEEVHAVFAATGLDFRSGRNLDLTAIATARLREAGVGRVHDLGLCTICSDPSLFFSHRRDHGVTGRQAGLAWLS